MAMEMNEIMQLIQAVSAYGLTSFELEEGNLKISLKREYEKKEGVTEAAGEMAEAVKIENPAVVVETKASSLVKEEVKETAVVAAEKTEEKEPSIPAGNVVTSPLVGVFYSAPAPDKDDYVKVGDTVKKGQVLGLIEAMKLMNEIESEYDGVVEAILAENEGNVEYGQPLFVIR